MLLNRLCLRSILILKRRDTTPKDNRGGIDDGGRDLSCETLLMTQGHGKLIAVHTDVLLSLGSLDMT